MAAVIVARRVLGLNFVFVGFGEVFAIAVLVNAIAAYLTDRAGLDGRIARPE